IIKRPDGGGDWTLNGSHIAATTSPQVAKRSLLSGFSEFGIADTEDCPTSPTTATKSPNVATVCEGTTLTLTGAATGGIDASCTIEYQYSTDGGSTWSAASATIPSFAAVAAGDNIIQ